MTHAAFEVVLKALVGTVHDLVYREGRGGAVRMPRVVRGEFVADAAQPVVELPRGPRVERRERADDAGPALRDHQSGVETMNIGAPMMGSARP